LGFRGLANGHPDAWVNEPAAGDNHWVKDYSGAGWPHGESHDA
jgi:hypothetical protein